MVYKTKKQKNYLTNIKHVSDDSLRFFFFKLDSILITNILNIKNSRYHCIWFLLRQLLSFPNF